MANELTLPFYTKTNSTIRLIIYKLDNPLNDTVIFIEKFASWYGSSWTCVQDQT